jgi:signal transduction histidine kinase
MVLAVDDQPASRELLVNYLDGVGCEVRQASDGESALAAVAEAPPDLILLDVMMPGLGGFAVTQRLKSNPRTATIPIVLITALNESADRLKGLAAGADEFLSKPVDRAELVARVRTLLRLKRLRDERQAVGDLGQRALAGVALPALLDEATALVADTLRVDCAAMWEVVPPGDRLVLRAGVGWQDGLVGQTTIGADIESQLGYTLLSRVPVVVEDLQSENRFSGPQLLHDHELTSGVSVVIDGRDRRAGVLSVHTRSPRAFTKDDIFFLEAVAQVVATAIIRKRAEDERVEALLCEQTARVSLEESNRTLAHTTQAKSEFLATMTGELRAPLTAILRSAETLLERLPADAEQRGLITDIQENGNHLLAMAEDILDLSRLEAGQLKTHPAPFALAEALQAVVAEAVPLAERKGIKLVTHVPSEVTTICADEEKIKRVLSHLLANAVKFTPPGGLVEASALVVNGAVELVVADTGIGISPEDHERIFEAFQQLGSSAVLQDKGRGLGLTQARRLVELLGGQIWVESAPGQGSRFGFNVPLAALALAPLSQPGALGPAAAVPGGDVARSAARFDDERAPVGAATQGIGGEAGATAAGGQWDDLDRAISDADGQALAGGA